MLNQEGGIEPEQFRVEALIDRVDALGKSFLGLTMNCCQCHDHKFDPFTQKDYYQFYAFLNNDDEAFLEVPTTEETKKREEIVRKIHDLEDKAMTSLTNLAERNQHGKLSATEIEELRAFAKADCVLGILNLRARKVLKKLPPKLIRSEKA